MFSDKRGSLVDPIYSSAYILKISITIFLGLVIWLGFQGVMSSVIIGSPSEIILTSVMSQLQTAYFSIDYVFPFLIGGLLLLSLIFAFKTGANILWGILSIIVWIIALLMATVFTNVYIAVSDKFPTIIAQMPIMDIIMMNLRWFVLFWIAAICAVMFRKNEAEDAQSQVQRRFYGK
jgi:hypothetical protein